MSDIIATQAWACGDKACRAQWHQRNFWAYCDGTYSVDEYSDGDHEDCGESDIPSHEEIDQSWRDYAQHVAETGADPLDNYFVRRKRTDRQAWEFRFSKSIIGPVLICARRGRKVYSGLQLPQHVREYLGLHRDGRRLQDFNSWGEFAEALPEMKAGQWFRQMIDHKINRNPETIARELRAAARKHLARP